MLGCEGESKLNLTLAFRAREACVARQEPSVDNGRRHVHEVGSEVIHDISLGRVELVAALIEELCAFDEARPQGSEGFWKGSGGPGVEEDVEPPSEHLSKGRDHLELARALVDIGDSYVAIMALGIEFAHVAHSPVDLHPFIADTVAHLGRVILAERGEYVGEVRGLLLTRDEGGGGGRPFLLELGLPLLAGFESIDPYGGLEDEGAGGLDLAFHGYEHSRNRGERGDRLAELRPLPGVAQGLAIGRLGDADRLGRYGEASPVHKGHRAAHEAEAALADEKGGGIRVLDLAGGRRMDA